MSLKFQFSFCLNLTQYTFSKKLDFDQIVWLLQVFKFSYILMSKLIELVPKLRQNIKIIALNFVQSNSFPQLWSFDSKVEITDGKIDMFTPWWTHDGVVVRLN